MNCEEIEQLAYKLWEDRGRPEGSPNEDWFRAEEELTLAPALIAGAASAAE
jgi:Protein of unknown function (DUF2934)